MAQISAVREQQLSIAGSEGESLAPEPNASSKPSPIRPRPPAAVHLFAGGCAIISSTNPFEHAVNPFPDISNSLGGMCGAVVTAPFDLIKTRLQSDLFQTRAQSSGSLPGSAGAAAIASRGNGLKALLWNFADTGLILRDVWRYEGPSALFKGLGPTLVGVVPGRSINFFMYGNGKHLYAEWFNHGRENALIHVSAAATAVMQLQQQERSHSTSSTSSPSTTLPKRPVLPTPPTGAPSPHFSHSFRSLTSPPSSLAPHRPTSYSTIISIFRRDGIKGFYRGLSASLLGVTEGTIQWGLYEQFKLVARRGLREDAEGGWRQSVAAGGAKLIATMITYPHEVVRTRLRQPVSPGQSPKYHGLLQSFKLVLREEGVKALYGGMSPHLLRVIPNAVCMFYVYESVLTWSRKFEQKKLDQRLEGGGD